MALGAVLKSFSSLGIRFFRGTLILFIYINLTNKI